MAYIHRYTCSKTTAVPQPAGTLHVPGPKDTAAPRPGPTYVVNKDLGDTAGGSKVGTLNPGTKTRQEI